MGVADRSSLPPASSSVSAGLSAAKGARSGRARRIPSATATDVTYDLNRALFAIRAGLDRVDAELSRDHPARRYLAELESLVTRGRDLAGRVRALTLPAASMRGVVHLGAVVDEALGMLRPTVPPAIAIDTDYAAFVPPVRVDPALLNEAIATLVGSAARTLTGGDGTIELRIDRVAVRREGLDAPPAMPDGECARLTVTTRKVENPVVVGRIGVAPAISDDAVTLGQAVVERLVDRCHGAVVMRRLPDGSSVTEVYVPAATADSAPAAAVRDFTRER